MPFQPGLVHTPITPFTREHGIDFDTFVKVLEFHMRHGAEALALPMHAGESVSLADDERRALLECALEQVGGRVPIIAHVSEAGTAKATALARHAEEAGAAAVVATTPYYWTPPPGMVLEHFAQIAACVRIPFLVHNAPEEMAGSKISAELMLKLMAKRDNVAGLVDATHDWQFLIELMADARRVRPQYQLLAGSEYMVSAGAIGATGMFSALAGVAPRLVRALFDLCRQGKLFEARPVQEHIAGLGQLLKPAGVAGLKAALRAMGRDVGDPRPPLLPLNSNAAQYLINQLNALAALRSEPRDW
jgi:dihydrodipicolinate synthase/N-acetylneuraminate lyase